MGDIMTFCVRFLAVSAIALACATSASAADLPAIKAGGANKVPACATPGRLMAFAQSRNGALADKFDGVGTEYMRHGEALGLRWDYAFFQMMVETANLKFVGDVNAKQNNFAGLGATGGGEPGESFKSVSEGVKAHLQHVLMYTGETVEEPVAERTRKVQEWGVLKSFQRGIKGAMTYAHLTRQWSPKDRGYSKDIASVADSFYGKFCDGADPRPELVAEARGKSGVTIDTAAAITRDKPSKGKDAARRAVAEARETGDSERKGLGAASLAATEPDTSSAAAAAPAAAPATYTLLNSNDNATSETKPAATAKATGGEIKTAAAAGAAAQTGAVMNDAGEVAAAKSKSACRVWQASYGGEKAVIIKVVAEGQTNFTVLDVNEGREQREVAAYIAAYAQDGTSVGEYASPTKALAKAFELCPEG